MSEFYDPAVQCLAVDIISFAAVQVVADERMTEAAHMTADLVSLACFKVQAQKRRAVVVFDRLVVGDRGCAFVQYVPYYL